MTFDEAIKDSGELTRHLILGNGFSIGCFPDIFKYSSLLENTDFNDKQELYKAFQKFETEDFEAMIKTLDSTAKLLPIYLEENNHLIAKIRYHAQSLRNSLIQTIAKSHPDNRHKIKVSQYESCYNFLTYFLGKENRKGRVYTLNYDLLLYWVLMFDHPFMKNLQKLNTNDGFIDAKGEDYVVWNGTSNLNEQRIHYLHGALHLFDAGDYIKKYTWSRTHRLLKDQICKAMEHNELPLFVAEGNSAQKIQKITHNAYLYHSYKSLCSIASNKNNCFFIFGHSLAENDQHILDALVQGKFPKLYVSIFGDVKNSDNQGIIERANTLARRRVEEHPLEVKFYQAESANVWGQNQYAQ